MSTINVVVGRKRNVKVSANGTAGVLDTTNSVTLKNTPTLSTSGNVAIDQLVDINLSQRNDGSTLVYDLVTDTYFVKPLEMTDVVGDLDGGTF